MSDIDRICKILMALDVRLARIERKVCGDPPISTVSETQRHHELQQALNNGASVVIEWPR